MRNHLSLLSASVTLSFLRSYHLFSSSLFLSLCDSGVLKFLSVASLLVRILNRGQTIFVNNFMIGHYFEVSLLSLLCDCLFLKSSFFRLASLYPSFPVILFLTLFFCLLIPWSPKPFHPLSSFLHLSYLSLSLSIGILNFPVQFLHFIKIQSFIISFLQTLCHNQAAATCSSLCRPTLKT